MLKTKILELTQIVSQEKGNIVSDMAGEKVMLSVKNGKYYNLGEIGGEIWDSIEEPISISDLVKELMDKYEVDKNECQDQVLSFLEMLVKEELVILSEGFINI